MCLRIVAKAVWLLFFTSQQRFDGWNIGVDFILIKTKEGMNEWKKRVARTVCGKRLSFRMCACFATSLCVRRHSRHYFQLNATFLFHCFILLPFYTRFHADNGSSRTPLIADIDKSFVLQMLPTPFPVARNIFAAWRHWHLIKSKTRLATELPAHADFAIENSHAVYNHFFISHFNNCFKNPLVAKKNLS